jgi:hypothetical protein
MTDEELQAFRRLASTEAQTMVAEIDRLRAENWRLWRFVDVALEAVPTEAIEAYVKRRAAIEGSK